MLTLDLTNAPRWHDLAPGVRVLEELLEERLALLRARRGAEGDARLSA